MLGAEATLHPEHARLRRQVRELAYPVAIMVVAPLGLIVFLFGVVVFGWDENGPAMDAAMTIAFTAYFVGSVVGLILYLRCLRTAMRRL